MIPGGTVLVVCTGNICRSPYIERQLRRLLDGTGIVVSSAGTQALAGHDMDPAVRSLLEQSGADVTGFSASQITPDMASRADLIITAAREHRAAVARLHPAALSRIVTVLDLADLTDGMTAADISALGSDGSSVARVGRAAAARRASVPTRVDPDIPDPFGRPMSAFREMARLVDRALEPIAAALTLRR